MLLRIKKILGMMVGRERGGIPQNDSRFSVNRLKIPNNC